MNNNKKDSLIDWLNQHMGCDFAKMMNGDEVEKQKSIKHFEKETERVREQIKQDEINQINKLTTNLVNNTIEMNEAIYRVSDLTEELFDLYLNREFNSHEQIKKLREIEKITPQLDKMIEGLVTIVVDLDKMEGCKNE